MRIDLQFGNLQPVTDNNVASRTTSAPASHSADRPDDAVLTSSDSRVSSLTMRAMAIPEIRADRVAELRDAGASGRYPVEPNAVADAMLNEIF